MIVSVCLSFSFEIEHLYWIVRIQSIMRGRSADMWVGDIVDMARTGREAGYKWEDMENVLYLSTWIYVYLFVRVYVLEIVPCVTKAWIFCI